MIHASNKKARRRRVAPQPQPTAAGCHPHAVPRPHHPPSAGARALPLRPVAARVHRGQRDAAELRRVVVVRDGDPLLLRAGVGADPAARAPAGAGAVARPPGAALEVQRVRERRVPHRPRRAAPRHLPARGLAVDRDDDRRDPAARVALDRLHVRRPLHADLHRLPPRRARRVRPAEDRPDEPDAPRRRPLRLRLGAPLRGLHLGGLIVAGVLPPLARSLAARASLRRLCASLRRPARPPASLRSARSTPTR